MELWAHLIRTMEVQKMFAIHGTVPYESCKHITWKSNQFPCHPQQFLINLYNLYNAVNKRFCEQMISDVKV